MKRISVGQLILDKAVYPRVDVDKDHMFNLQEAYKCHVDLPPPIICGQSLRVVDGFHRVSAIIRLHGVNTIIEVVERFYKSDRELFLDAVRLNARNGKNLTTCDRRRAAGIANRLSIDPDLLAAELSVSPSLLGGLSVASRASSNVATSLKAASLTTSKMSKRSSGPIDPMQDLKQSIRSCRAHLGQVNPTAVVRDRRLVEAINALHEDVDDFVRAMKRVRTA